jgi:hypothetical protein
MPLTDREVSERFDAMNLAVALDRLRETGVQVSAALEEDLQRVRREAEEHGLHLDVRVRRPHRRSRKN